MDTKTPDTSEAKNWLLREGYADAVISYHPEQVHKASLENLMERYANHRSRELRVAIIDFRQRILLNGGLSDFTILKKFDEHFGIVKVQGGNNGE